MKFLKKSALSLSVILASGLSMSNPASAQYPNQMQIYQTKCSQGDQYSCIQLEQMYRRNERWRDEINKRREDFDESREDLEKINQREACRRGSYSFNNSYCNYIN